MKLTRLESAPDYAAFVNDDTPPQRLPFSQAVQTGGLIFVSGQAATDENGALMSGTFEEEFRRSVANLEAVLVAAGSSLERVVQVRSYIRDAANVPLYNALYREVFSAPFPARTTITGCLPPALHFELECIALANLTSE